MISNRRRGQGMTEYIVLVGLIAVLLIAAVGRFKNQIQVTIEGTTGVVNDLDTPVGAEVPGTVEGGGRGTFKKTGSNTYSAVPDDGGTYSKNPETGEFVRNP